MTDRSGRWNKVVTAVLLVSAAAAAATDWEAQGRRWWSHVQYLADDKLEGRNTVSAGHRQAAAYVAEQFERAGLKPAGTSGYFQPIRFLVREIDAEHSSLALVRDGKTEPVKLGDEATFSLRSDLAEAIEAPAVFLGYGFAVPEKGHDDFAGLDLRGKVAVSLTGGPPTIPSALRAHYQSSAERWKALKKAGAIGVAVIPNPTATDIPWSRASLARLQPSMDLAEPELQETQGLKFAITINPGGADKFLAGSR